MHIRSASRQDSTHTEHAPRFGTEYRTDLQGIRAIAVLLVLLYHAGVPGISGGFVGVDIFFVLSGYLITGIVAREIATTASFSLIKFYARRIIRIVPAATIVLLATALATYLWLPITQWSRVAQEIVGSALYFSNWQFAASTNYLNASAAPSPLQHFWSLAVEEQYYLLWPALLALAIYLVHRSSKSVSSEQQIKKILLAAAWIMLVITAISFTVSLVAMNRWSTAAYFITPTRLWELGVGSVLALSVPALRSLSTLRKRYLSTSGLFTVLLAAIFYNETTPFPGLYALLPVVGTAAMIAGGLNSRYGYQAQTILQAPLLIWLGNLSYSLYLWHWPMLIFAESLFPNLTPGYRLLVTMASIVPAYLSLKFLETPLLKMQRLRSSPSLAIGLGVAAVAASIVAALLLMSALNLQSSSPIKAPSASLGAGSLSIGEFPRETTVIPEILTPSLANAQSDNPQIYEDGCHLEFSESTPIECTYGDTTGPLVLLTGDSHAAQWFPALEVLAEQNGFRLVSMTKASCPFAAVDIELITESRSYMECSSWNKNVLSYIQKDRPVLVVTSALMGYTPILKSQITLSGGLRQSWKSSTELGSKVLVIADTPYMSSVIPDCLARNSSDPAQCRTPHAEAFSNVGLETDAAAGLPSVTVIDLNEKICPGDMCEPIIGNALVYRDQHHLSETYARTLSPFLADQAGILIPQS